MFPFPRLLNIKTREMARGNCDLLPFDKKSLIEKIFSLIRFFKKRPGLDASFDQRIKRFNKDSWNLTKPISEQEFNCLGLYYYKLWRFRS